MTNFSYDILVLTKGKLTDEFDRAILTKIKTNENQQNRRQERHYRE